MLAHRLDVFLAANPHMLLVKNARRSTESLGDLGQPDTTDGHRRLGGERPEGSWGRGQGDWKWSGSLRPTAQPGPVRVGVLVLPAILMGSSVSHAGTELG